MLLLIRSTAASLWPRVATWKEQVCLHCYALLCVRHATTFVWPLCVDLWANAACGKPLSALPAMLVMSIQSLLNNQHQAAAAWGLFLRPVHTGDTPPPTSCCEDHHRCNTDAMSMLAMQGQGMRRCSGRQAGGRRLPTCSQSKAWFGGTALGTPSLPSCGPGVGENKVAQQGIAACAQEGLYQTCHHQIHRGF